MKFWSFIQDELLGMNWLNGTIGIILQKFWVDISGKWGGSLQFFLYAH